MAKIAILTDTHCGVRGDSKVFLDHQERFYSNVFFPACKVVDYIFHGGDMFDKRKHTNTGTLKRFREHFVEPLQDLGKDMFVVCGNHDAHLRQTNEVNSLRELLPVDTSRMNITIVDRKPVEFMDFCLVPWMTQDNEDDCLRVLLTTKKPFVLGHFEMAGFPFYRGIMAEHGLDSAIFKKFKRVFSGHYHTKTVKGNITYLGTSMEFTWADYNDPKGFHIFDTETQILEFIPNPDKMFFQYVYDNSPLDVQDNIEDRCVKLIVKNKDDPKLFERTLEDLRNRNPFELSVADRTVVKYQEGVETEAKTTPQIMNDYIDAIEGLPKKRNDSLKVLMSELYSEVCE